LVQKKPRINLYTQYI